MWVADMDFNPPKSVTKALEKEVSHGVLDTMETTSLLLTL